MPSQCLPLSNPRLVGWRSNHTISTIKSYLTGLSCHCPDCCIGMINLNDREEIDKSLKPMKHKWNPDLAHLEYHTLSVEHNMWWAEDGPPTPLPAKTGRGHNAALFVPKFAPVFVPVLGSARKIMRNDAFDMFVESCTNPDYNYDIPVRIIDIVAALMNIPDSLGNPAGD